MNFIKVLTQVIHELDQREIQYALIGGFAMSLHGVQRATMDLDFILLFDDLKIADKILSDFSYELAFKNENVSHYESNDADWGRIDIIHAFRAKSLGMLKRSERIQVTDDLSIPLAKIEDIIGLKLQAIANDKSRELSDWFDIQSLMIASVSQSLQLDWELLEDYFELFHFTEKFIELKGQYESTQ